MAKKKLIASVMAAVMALAFIPAVAFADYTNTDPTAGPTYEGPATPGTRGVYTVYGNGFPLLIKESKSDYTSVFWDKGTIGAYDAGVDEPLFEVFAQAANANSNTISVYGGAKDIVTGKPITITMLSGRIDTIYGGGGADVNETGDIDISITSAGELKKVYLTGTSGNRTGNATLTQSADGHIKSELNILSGGSVTGDVNVTAKANCEKIYTTTLTAGTHSSAKSLTLNLMDGYGTKNVYLGNFTNDNSTSGNGTLTDGKYDITLGGSREVLWYGNAAQQGDPVRRTLSLGSGYMQPGYNNPQTVTGGFDPRLFHEIKLVDPFHSQTSKFHIYPTMGGGLEPTLGDVVVSSGAKAEDVGRFTVLKQAAGLSLKYDGAGRIVVGDGNNQMKIGDQTYTLKKGDPLPDITGKLPTPPANMKFDGYYDQKGGKGTKFYNADGSAALAGYPADMDAMLYANYALDMNEGHDVQGKVIPGTTATYKLDIGWGNMQFVYTKTAQKWNPATHAYEGAVSAEWSGFADSNNRVTVKNHSNAAVTADFALALSALGEGITTNWYGDEALSAAANQMSLAYCPEAAAAAAVPTDMRYLKLSGEPTKLTAGDPFKLAGVITVTVNADSLNTALTPDTGKTA